jgi:histidinol-phosphate aminotransferase
MVIPFASVAPKRLAGKREEPMLKPRPAVLKMKEYHPPLGGRQGMRLDFNENTVGCSPRVLERLRSLGPEELATYPERAPVERAVAHFLGRSPEQVLLTNGVDEAIHLLCQTYIDPGDEMLIPVPTYAMYEIYAGAAGATVVSVPAEPGFGFPAAALLRSITPRTRLIAVATPNNPTGAVAEEATLLQLAQAAPGAALLADEAYFEFYGKTLMPRIGELPNLFVTRTFSKAYGLAGLRAGVLAGSVEQMPLVRRAGSPYSVNAAALVCLREAIADIEYVANYASQVRCGRERLQAELQTLGVRFWPSEANFVLFYLGEHRAAFIEAMRWRGVLVRDRHKDPGCAGCVRLTLGTDAQNSAALLALRSALDEIGWKPEAASAGELGKRDRVIG